jgi:glycine/D-amino acid oxidase-like deaminating enzyme
MIVTEATVEAVVCGAGIAGISAAYHLSRHTRTGRILLVDERAPFSLTSDKSTECYRNWWPGPDVGMVRLMNRSIDLLEALAEETGNAFHLNRRGYLYLTADEDRLPAMHAAASATSALGAGPLREHPAGTSGYAPAKPEGFADSPIGADWITDLDLLHRCFPGLSPKVIAGLHIRRAGWFSAQQLGAMLLNRGRAAGVEVRNARLIGIHVSAGRVSGVRLESPAGQQDLATPIFVDAAGPYMQEVARFVGVDLPVYHELHAKIAFGDSSGVVDRNAPLLVWDDSQTLDWSAEERQALRESHHETELIGRMPSGVHARPEGGRDSPTVLALWPYHTPAVLAQWPLSFDPAYAEVVIRGLTAMLPGMQTYRLRPPRPYVDGGYYTRTRENRPLIGPLGVEGAFVIGALSGFGLMVAIASGELLAAHALGLNLPEYASAFSPRRYEDPGYSARFADWDAGGQL